MIFNILDNTTKLWMTKYIIGEIFSSGGATLYKNPSDQTVCLTYHIQILGIELLIQCILEDRQLFFAFFGVLCSIDLVHLPRIFVRFGSRDPFQA